GSAVYVQPRSGPVVSPPAGYRESRTGRRCIDWHRDIGRSGATRSDVCAGGGGCDCLCCFAHSVARDERRRNALWIAAPVACRSGCAGRDPGTCSSANVATWRIRVDRHRRSHDCFAGALGLGAATGTFDPRVGSGARSGARKVSTASTGRAIPVAQLDALTGSRFVAAFAILVLHGTAFGYSLPSWLDLAQAVWY